MKSNVEWKKWGEVDPLYAVASWAGKQRGQSNPWTDEEFYELGRSDWADFVRHWQGTFMIHLPLYELPDMAISKFVRPVFGWSKRLSDWKAAIDRRRMLRGTGSGVMRRLRFQRSALWAALRQIGFEQLECRGFSVRSNDSFHDFVFGRRLS